MPEKEWMRKLSLALWVPGCWVALGSPGWAYPPWGSPGLELMVPWVGADGARGLPSSELASEDLGN